MRQLRKIWSTCHTKLSELEMETPGFQQGARATHHNKLVPLFWWRWRRLQRHILETTSKRLLSQCLPILMILKDKQLRMLARSQILRSRESLMSQQLLHWPLVWTKQMEKLLLCTIWVVEHSIFPFLKFLEVFSKLKLQMVIHHLVERTSIWPSNNF